MRSRCFKLYLAFLFFLLLPGLSLSAQGEGPGIFSLGLGVDYATGDYGTETTTDAYSLTLTLGAYPTDRLDLQLDIPFLHQSSGFTTISGGVRFGVDRTSGPRSMGGGGMATPVSAAEETESVSGLGDLVFSAGYILVEEGEGWPRVRPNGYVKFPTAEEERGLGTGEFDFAGGLEVVKWAGRWRFRGEGSRVFQGENDELGLRDFWTYGAGVGRQMTDAFRPELSFWGASAPADGAEEQREVRLKGIFYAGDSVAWELYLARGLSDGSPDLAAGISLYHDL